MLTSRGSFNIVIAFLGATLLLCLSGVIILTVTEKAVPDIIELLATAALTGLIGLLTKTPEQGEEKNDTAQEVRVINAREDAVPVENEVGNG